MPSADLTSFSITGFSSSMQSENAASARVRMTLARQLAEAVLRMRQVITQRDVARSRSLTCARQALDEIREAVAILGLVGIVDLRLRIAALLRAASRAPRRA